MNVSDITGASAAALDAQRTTAVLARSLRIEREQAAATIALIEQVQQGAPATGRILDVRV